MVETWGRVFASSCISGIGGVGFSVSMARDPPPKKNGRFLCVLEKQPKSDRPGKESFFDCASKEGGGFGFRNKTHMLTDGRMLKLDRERLKSTPPTEWVFAA